MRNDGNPFWKKFKVLLPSEFFPWVMATGCFEDGDAPYLHIQGCPKHCGRACNERGPIMGRILKGWKERQSCSGKSWGSPSDKSRWGKRPRFRFDDPN